MIYSGPKHSANDKLFSFKIPSDEVIVMQYQNNSNSIIVYKSYLRSNGNIYLMKWILFYSFLCLDEFTFKSHRLLNTPFTIAIYINGVVDSRLSACCEQGFLQHYRSQLKRSAFQLLFVSGGIPCYAYDMIVFDLKRKITSNFICDNKMSNEWNDEFIVVCRWGYWYSITMDFNGQFETKNTNR